MLLCPSSNPDIKGLNPSTDSGREKMTKEIIELFDSVGFPFRVKVAARVQHKWKKGRACFSVSSQDSNLGRDEFLRRHLDKDTLLGCWFIKRCWPNAQLA
jgi:hypothetical protein